MANTTVKGAIHIHGQNPQFLVEKVIRTRIWESEFWKEQCFALTAESLIDKAIELNSIGGVYGNQRPTHFLCLLLKLLQIQPEKEILIEYLMADEFKYLRALTAMYIRMTFPAVEVYELLEPLLKDYRKLRLRNMNARAAGYHLTFIDEFVDQLLTEERVCDIILPRLMKRAVLEETEGLAPRTSVLFEAMAGNKSGSEDEGEDRKVRNGSRSAGLERSVSRGRSLSRSSRTSSTRSKSGSASIKERFVSKSPSRSRSRSPAQASRLLLCAQDPRRRPSHEGRVNEPDGVFKGAPLSLSSANPFAFYTMITRHILARNFGRWLPNVIRSRPLSLTSAVRSEGVEPPPAGGHSSSITESPLLRTTREVALRTPGISWKDEANENGRETRKMNMYQSLREAMSVAMTKDDTAVVFGEDVAFGGVFRCTMGLAEEFGRQRVFNTPLTEQGIAGFAIGLASMGHTAIAEIQFADYIYPAFDQIVNEAAKFRYRSGGRYNVGGLTIRTPSMSVGHGGLYHSQSPEGFFMGAAGLKVVIPRSPIQAKGLLLSSIRDPNPVIFLEPKILYRSSVEQVPVDDYELPLGKAEIMTKGNDLTLLTYGSPVYTCENATNLLRNPPPSIAHLIPESVRGASIELIDLRTILPWDVHTVAESVKKTGRLVIVHEAGKTMGPGAEIAAEVTKRCFLNLHAPVKRITGWDTPVALVYEKFYIPDALRIVDGIVETLKY
ncbi:Pyruvate dehydrogenase [Ceratobasidium theobromae]|uniref:3-methyl-2-oxobutanoate dehydrogenase (2-methylpropanoyl-transferring) n=1 Tax=Ceratobasidium theobromae TaxID=1582974 RepID=A0A5N5R0L1_9AGAM|nr:Pyruvate dehydrogenase [Ceratobasidium theobromae]